MAEFIIDRPLTLCFIHLEIDYPTAYLTRESVVETIDIEVSITCCVPSERTYQVLLIHHVNVMTWIC